MRHLTFDSFEFTPPDSEQFLEVWIAARSRDPFPDVEAFAAVVEPATRLQPLGPSQPFFKLDRGDLVCCYLVSHANVDVPPWRGWPSYVLTAGPLDYDVILELPSQFIRFHWWSTA